jgi:hypothetical protein
LKKTPTVSVILTNARGEILLQLRDDKPRLVWYHPASTESLQQDIGLLRQHFWKSFTDAAFEAGMAAGSELELSVMRDVLEDR